MIGNLKMPFLKTNETFAETNMVYIKLHLLEGEKIIRDLPTYQSGDVYVFFTHKRMVFTHSPNIFSSFDIPYEIEFLHYNSIQRFTFLESCVGRNYQLNIVVSDSTEFSIFFTELNEVMKVLDLIGMKNL